MLLFRPILMRTVQDFSPFAIEWLLEQFITKKALHNLPQHGHNYFVVLCSLCINYIAAVLILPINCSPAIFGAASATLFV